MKINKIICGLLSLALSLTTLLAFSSDVNALELNDAKISSNFEYTLVKGNDNERIIEYIAANTEVRMVYNKIKQTITVYKTKDGITATLILKVSLETRAGNSSMFSPRKYKKTGNMYTLTSGVGLPAILSDLGASAAALTTGDKIVKLYARAKSAYLAI